MVVQFVVLFLSRAIFRETSTELDVKTVKWMLSWKTNPQKFAMVCSLIDQNLAVKPLARGPWFHLSLQQFDVISTVVKSTDHGKL